jgi:hypothetical protein
MSDDDKDEQWTATKEVYRTWRSSSENVDDLRQQPRVIFDTQRLDRIQYFTQQAEKWYNLRKLAEESPNLLELAEWLDTGDRYSLRVERYLEDKVPAASRTAECKVEAIDFLGLHHGEINEDIMDAAMASLCSLSNNRGTCSTSAWWSKSKPMDVCIEEIRRKKKIVLAVRIDGHWIGVFMDNELGAVSIYNSFGADGSGSERVHKTVCDVVLPALG